MPLQNYVLSKESVTTVETSSVPSSPILKHNLDSSHFPFRPNHIGHPLERSQPPPSSACHPFEAYAAAASAFGEQQFHGFNHRASMEQQQQSSQSEVPVDVEGDDVDQQHFSGLNFKSIYPLAICSTSNNKSTIQQQYKSPERRSPKKYDKRTLNEETFSSEKKLKKMTVGGYKKTIIAKPMENKAVDEDGQQQDKDCGNVDDNIELKLVKNELTLDKNNHIDNVRPSSASSASETSHTSPQQINTLVMSS